MGKIKQFGSRIGLIALVLALALPGAAWAENDAAGPNAAGTEVENETESKTQEPEDPSAGSATDINLDIKAKTAVLLDAATGEFLYEQSGHEELPPASVTKIMTMLLALEAEDAGKISLTDEVTISDRAAGMGGSQMFMEPGETRTVEELLMGMAMASANDACVAIAEYVGGTEEIFVEMMNKRAKELGMNNTCFVNTNGLPVSGHYTSAYDIGIMSAELLKHEEIAEFMTTWMQDVTIGKTGKESTFTLTNTNRLIKLYPDAIGIKTGFTQDAGFCLSGAARRGELTLVAVVLGCKSTNERWQETMRLLDYGFATYDSLKLTDKGQVMDTAEITKASPAQVDAITDSEVRVLIEKGRQDGVSCEAILFEDLKAPIAEGEQIGELVITKDGKEWGRRPLLAACPVEKAGFIELTARLLKGLF